MRLRLVIVDDSLPFLEAARAFLEQEGIAVIGVASSCSEAVQKVEELQPDVTLIDMDIGGDSGFEVARRLEQRSAVAPSPTILISTHSESDFADLIEASPALGFLSKSDLSARAIYDLLGIASNGRG